MSSETISSAVENFDQPQSLLSRSENQPLAFFASTLFKRLFDICFASVSLILSAPVLLFAATVVALQSPGSPIFVQRRVGQNGKVFNIYKIRSMYSGADSDGFRTANEDRRLTPIGAILRSTNIDELPQLFNVLKGDMSLIGPRPLSVEETRYISRQLNISSSYPGFYPVARPGLVGLEQVNRDKELTYLERFRFNHEYELSYGPLLDLQIFLKALSICRHVCVATVAGGIGIVCIIGSCWQLFR